MFSKLSGLFSASTDKLFAVVGRLVLVTSILFLIGLLIAFIFKIPSFTFDPFGLILMIWIIFYLKKISHSQSLMVDLLSSQGAPKNGLISVSKSQGNKVSTKSQKKPKIDKSV